MSLRKKTIAGFKWSAFEQGSVQVSQFVIGIWMARLLLPEDFGLVAMVTVITGLLALFIDNGLGSALIYLKDLSEADKSSMFWVNIAIGFILFVGLAISAQYIANFYREPILERITYLVGFNFMLNSTIPVQLSLFQKELDFKKIFYAREIALFLSGGIGIFMAYSGYGVWSIISRMLLMTALFSLLLWRFSPWKPKLIFRWNRLKVMLNYSLPLLGNNILGYAKKNMDTLVVGKFLGAYPLGIYNKSYQLMVFPGNQITGMIGKVLFASFSQINQDKEKLWQTYLIAAKGIMILSIVLALTIFFAAESFVVNILGSKWLEAIPIIKIMALVGLVQPTTRSIGALFNAVGATKLAFKISMITTPFYLGCVLVGALWGIKGIAIGVVLGIVVTSLPQIHLALRKVNRTIFDLMEEAKMIVLSGAIIFAIVKAGSFLFGNMESILWLLILPLVITLLMLAFSLLLFRKDADRIIKVVFSK